MPHARANQTRAFSETLFPNNRNNLHSTENALSFAHGIRSTNTQVALSRDPIRLALIIVALWTVHGLLVGFNAYYVYSFSKNPARLSQALIEQMGGSYIWAAATPLVLWWGTRYSLRQRKWWVSVLAHLPLAIFLTFATVAVWNYTAHVAAWGKWPKDIWAVLRNGVANLETGLLQYTFVVLFQQLYWFYRRHQEELVRASQLETQLARAQFMALRMQLNPHFLFNTLNTISELIHAQPRQAERMLIQLGTFLRTTLQSAGTQEIPLERELDFLDQYLEIERIRFGDRIQVEMALDAETMAAQVPNFLLQPLVENALHHGLRDKTSQGKLRIEATRSNGHLEVTVFDNGPGVLSENGQRPEVPEVREGLGLGNTRERLRKLYGADHQFACRNVTGGFEVTVSIPYRLKEN